MSYSIRVPNGILTMVNVEFECPNCSCLHSEDDYYNQLNKSKCGIIYKGCKCCKTKIGITTNMIGDVCVWLKSDESKNRLLSYKSKK